MTGPRGAAEAAADGAAAEAGVGERRKRGQNPARVTGEHAQDLVLGGGREKKRKEERNGPLFGVTVDRRGSS